MNVVDYIGLGLLAFYFWRGWSKGLVRSLFGPIATVVSVWYSYIYFKETHNFMVSVVICIAGPIVLNIIFSAFYAIIGKAKGKDEKEGSALQIQNRFFGGILNALWIMCMFVLCLVLFAMIPIRVPFLDGSRSAVVESRSFGLISAVFGKRFAFLRKGVEPIDLEKNQDYLPKLQKTKEYEELMSDKRIRVLFEDPETQKKIEKRDVMGLLNDPRIQEIMQDPELVRKFLILNQRILESSQMKTEGGPNADDIH